MTAALVGSVRLGELMEASDDAQRIVEALIEGRLRLSIRPWRPSGSV
ncbi:MAG: hypothetical protein JO081_08685 [Alphaproteobacteria bacterium]|nr:hypothetical protein [Alphaproteobacteria bacterium]